MCWLGKPRVVKSVAYAYLSYYSAYLKANYPVEFYCACISCETDPEAQSIYVNDAKRFGIEILPPSLNESELDFTIAKDKILYGFKGLKGVGDKAIEQILDHRPYTSAVGFLRAIVDNKMKVPKQVIEALIKIGAFDEFGINRRIMLDTYDKFILDYKSYLKKPEASLPLLFNDDTVVFYGESSDLTLFDILTYEKKYMGIYISGNPFDFAKNVIGNGFSSYTESLHMDNSSIFCEILSIKTTKTKSKGEKMAIYKCLDINNVVFEFPLFPDLYAKIGENLFEGSFVIVNFKNSKRGQVCVSIKDVNESINNYTKTQKSENSIQSIFLKVNSIMDLKKFMTRKDKTQDFDKTMERPCHLFFGLGNYTFKIGETTFNSSSESIRFLNQLEGVDIKLKR